ncbi:ATP-binding protein [Streptomyces lichenis]|uniref:ATP-binding protein n=1 Tax=Streptomyces lichenis TaxID=2306967 RepID=A0ABT0IDU3_9ACTN|nr:ATP-binding protein [Streptomyces lichenis]MCK8679497.1 ATP-binding protein [Streptomyces lichenis]
MPQSMTRAHPIGHPGYHETLPRSPESAATARRLVRLALTAWGLREMVEDAVLVVSELAGNAVRHAEARTVRVTVERPAPGRVRISVTDGSKVPPEPRRAGARDENGRGLVLVTALAGDWGTTSLPTGKAVWAELGGRRDR